AANLILLHESQDQAEQGVSCCSYTMYSLDRYLDFPILSCYQFFLVIVTRASSWDAELQDLVHQVDIIVNSKKVEWERKMKAFEAQMDIQHQELARAQSKLDQKGQEVELLCQKLENLEKTNCEMAQNYETQLCALKSQVRKKSVSSFSDLIIRSLNTLMFLKLTHSYEKLLKQRNRQGRENCKETPETTFDPSKLNKKLEKQTQSYQFQISNKKQNQEEMVKYGQPEREKDGLIVEKLRAAVNEMIISRDRIEEENLKLREDLKMFQNQCQIRNPFYPEEPSHCSEQERIRTEISDLTEELHQKEITIATIMEKASLLERRLKTELQIKDKLLTKQQLLNFRYKDIKSENTHLKESMEDQKYKSCMVISFTLF
ncbi:hypothetical protein ASZ78_004382, partial [Callipepla squamata]